MKFIVAFSFLLAAASAQAQHTLQKLWETEATLAIPESVLPDDKNDVLYVSLINGGPWEADGKGGVAIVSKRGDILNDQWIAGLNAPKGLGKYNNKLYVADLREVVVIDINSKRITAHIPVAGSQNLNDLTIDAKGVIYVSDSKLNQVYRIEKGNAEVYLTNLPSANGVKAIGNDLYILTSKDIYRAGPDKKLNKIGELEHGGDGIEPVGNGDFIVSSWSGYIYYLDKTGKTDLVLDTHDQQKNTADIGYEPAKKIVYVPTFMGKSVVAYQLK